MSNQHISLEEIVSHMPGHIYWKNKSGTYLGCNLNLAQVLKLKSPQDILGMTVYDLVQDFDSANVVNKTDISIMSANQPLVLEENGLDINGNPAVYFTKKQPLHDTQGNVIGLLGISLDITEKKRAEKEILKAREEAEAANRSKTEFLANVSHDVKSPLASILMCGQAILENTENTQNIKQYAEILISCQKRLATFFRNCLDNANFELEPASLKEEKFSLNNMLQELNDIFLHLAKSKNFYFNTCICNKVPDMVIGNQTMLFRILLNLTNNALKFTEKGGLTLHITLNAPITSEYANIQIQVKDTGIGIPKDKQQKIFERLSRLAPAFSKRIEGSGIGLYIVDQYVKAMNGKIEIESELGQGSCFTVTLPLKIALQG